MWRNPIESFVITNIKYFPEHKGEVNSCAFSPDCQILLACSDDNRVYVWNVKTQKLICKVKGHTGPVNACAFSPDCSIFASASHDCTVRVWKTATTECLHVLKVLCMTNMILISDHLKSVETVCFNPDSRQLLSAGWDYTAILWDAQLGLNLKTFYGHQDVIQSSAFSLNGQFLKIHLMSWPLENKGQSPPIFIKAQVNIKLVSVVLFWPWDTQVFKATGSWDYTAKLWNLRKDEPEKTLEGHKGNVSCVCFSVSGMLATGSWDRTVRVWNPKKGVLIFLLEGHSGWVKSVAFSKDGILLATAADDDMVHVWDCGNGKCIKILEGKLDLAYVCTFAPNGALMTTGAADLGITL
ncbi:WD repeat-containing protein 38 [Latimeria chalumnae]|uniref:WD repeat-containing protein 38 n=1 Tax=Latimeria chalumnae TaxID=7897 RepID=UPI00313D9294